MKSVIQTPQDFEKGLVPRIISELDVFSRFLKKFFSKLDISSFMSNIVDGYGFVAFSTLSQGLTEGASLMS